MTIISVIGSTYSLLQTRQGFKCEGLTNITVKANYELILEESNEKQTMNLKTFMNTTNKSS